MPVDAVFEDLELHSLSTGEDASGEAVVTVISAGQRNIGTAIHKDIILAAAKAYVAAVNGVIMARKMSEARQEASGE
jgi:2-isopropylmalate synthase